MRARLARWADAASGYLWDNPVFLKEYRLHFRSNRTYLVHFAYLFVLGLVLTVLVLYSHLSAQGGGLTALWKVGQYTFRVVIVLHAVFLSILLSSLAAASVTSERESNTLEVLKSLPMTTGMFVSGKFVSLMVLTGLLILSSMPLFMLALGYVGGVGAEDILSAYLTLTGLSAVCISGGILSSAVSDNTRGAMFMCLRVLFLCMIVGTFGGTLTYSFLSSISSAYTSGYMDLIAAPFMGPSLGVTIILIGTYTGLSSLMLTAAADRLRPAEEKRPYLLLTQIFAAFNLCIIALLVSIIVIGMRVASAPSPYNDLGFMIMQASAILVLTVLVLPVPECPQQGWRGLFSVGPFHGTAYLFLILVVSDVVLALLRPFIPNPVVPGSVPPLEFSAWLMGQGLIAGMLVLCAGIAKFGVALSRRYARAIYFSGLILAFVFPLLLHSIFLREERSIILTPILWLNPWIALAQIDPKTGEAIMGTLAIPGGGEATLFSGLLSPFFGACLIMLGMRMSPERKQ